AAQAAHIDKLGAAIVARPDFWEAGADREIGRFIGWWKDGVRRPDFDLPEVRSALAGELKRTGSVRAIQRLIVTSPIYTAPPRPPAGPQPERSGHARAAALVDGLDEAPGGGELDRLGRYRHLRSSRWILRLPLRRARRDRSDRRRPHADPAPASALRCVLRR